MGSRGDVQLGPHARAVHAAQTIALRHRTTEKNDARAEAIDASTGFTATEALSR
jgi:hypothetical protein